MSNKDFWTVNDHGEFVLRDLEYEATNWFDKRRGVVDPTKIPDSYNSCWFEIFDFYDCGSDGCDYERYGCQINPGDVVVDIGANIGVFSHRAETRGASVVYSFEPISKTFQVLQMNAGPKTRIFKNAIFSEQRILKMSIPDKESLVGGGTMAYQLENIGRASALDDFVVTIDINSLFEKNMIGKIDFMKMDIEGAEIECLQRISDSNLFSLRCLAVEFHRNIPGMDEFRDEFLSRCNRLGFKHFTNYYQGGKQMTINIWHE